LRREGRAKDWVGKGYARSIGEEGRESEKEEGKTEKWGVPPPALAP